MRLFIEFSMTFAFRGSGLLTLKHETFTTIYHGFSAERAEFMTELAHSDMRLLLQNLKISCLLSADLYLIRSSSLLSFLSGTEQISHDIRHMYLRAARIHLLGYL